MKPLPPISPRIAAALLGVAVGLGLSTRGSEATPEMRLPLSTQLVGPAVLDPIHALPRTTLALAMEEARGYLNQDRPWAAWNAIKDHLEDDETASPAATLLGARAASRWGGWKEVRSLLRGRAWLGTAEGGEGLYLLGRAEEEGKNWSAAERAYRRYVAGAQGRSRGVAAARLAGVLERQGSHRAAAISYASAAAELSGVGDWMLALSAEAAAKEGVVTPVSGSGGSAVARARRALAEAEGWSARGDVGTALETLQREATRLTAEGDRAGAGPLLLERARLLLEQKRVAEARGLLRDVAREAGTEAGVRVAAARLLGEQSGLGDDEQRARAAAYEAGGKPGLAAKALRALESSDPADRLARGMLLFEERDYGPARAVLNGVAPEVADPEAAARAELYAAWSGLRNGQRSAAIDELLRLVERRPGTAAAGSAYFLLGDAGNDRARAIERYRSAAAIERSPEAREALYRLGDRSLAAGDVGAAVSAWERYLARYSRGEQSAEVGYRVGRLRERDGQEPRARAAYTAALLADPVSYYSFLAANRLGVDPLGPTLSQPRPWVGLAADQAGASVTVARLALLEEAGLDDAWEAELADARRRFADRPLALLTLAEGLRDAGHPIEGIRIGRGLLADRGGLWDRRLLHVVFPFPYRDLIQREAKRGGVDPMLLAGLVRQESSFDPEARSWVGATGLSQIMPATGRWLAPGAGIDDYEGRLLSVPEVNLRMGAGFLGDLVDRYHGARDLALAGYNAGPGRADRWRRELGHARDPEAFRERIPFDETRGYVKLVLRNAAVYEALYGSPRDYGLARSE